MKCSAAHDAFSDVFLPSDCSRPHGLEAPSSFKRYLIIDTTRISRRHLHRRNYNILEFDTLINTHYTYYNLVPLALGVLCLILCVLNGTENGEPPNVVPSEEEREPQPSDQASCDAQVTRLPPDRHRRAMIALSFRSSMCIVSKEDSEE